MFKYIFKYFIWIASKSLGVSWAFLGYLGALFGLLASLGLLGFLVFNSFQDVLGFPWGTQGTLLDLPLNLLGMSWDFQGSFEASLGSLLFGFLVFLGLSWVFAAVSRGAARELRKITTPGGGEV